MKLGSSRAIKSGKWTANEMLIQDDINALSEFTYQNITDLLAMLAEQGVASGTTKDLVLSGLLLEWSTALTCNLRSGASVSYQGRYFTTGVWGFVFSSGEIFSIVVDEDTAVAFDTGDSQVRVDLLEIRPVLLDYELKTRQFKDPITGLVSSSLVNTRREYGFEFQIKKGTPGGSPVAPSKTSGWIKLAEVTILAYASSINQSNIKDVRNSLTWTTEVSATKYRLVHDFMIEDGIIYGAKIPNDGIKDFHIDFGVGADQISAVDIPIVDAGSYFPTNNVEAALQEIGVYISEDETFLTSVDAINIGQPVGIKYEASYCKPMAKQLATLSYTANITDHSNTCWLGDNFILIVYNSGSTLYGRVAQYNESTEALSWATSATNLLTIGGGSTGYISISSFGSGYKAVIGVGYAPAVVVAVVTFNGTDTLSLTASYSFGVSRSPVFVLALRTNGEFLVLTGASGTVYARVGHESGGSIVWDTSETTIATGMLSTYLHAAIIDNEINVVIVWAGTSNYATVRIMKWNPASPSTITFPVAALAVSNDTATFCPMAIIMGKTRIDIFIPTATGVRVSVVEWSREGGYIGWNSAEGIAVGIIPDMESSICKVGGIVSLLVNNQSVLRMQLLALKWDGGGHRLLWDLTYEPPALYQRPFKMREYRNGCVIFMYTDNTPLHYLVIAQIPELIGLAKNAITAGGAGIVKFAGKISGLSGMTRGKVYGMDYYTGELGDNNVIPLTRAISTTEELIIPIK